MNIDTTDLLLRLTGERSVRSVALKADYDPSTLTRQIKSGIKAETLIDIARACGIPVVATLAEFGFISNAEARAVSIGAALSSATDEQLAQEILDRVKQQGASTVLTNPIDQIANVGGQTEDEIPHLGNVDFIYQEGVALAADERDGVEQEQEQSQEQP